tara:strand:+ start:1210 stop:2061 length:852 start_codon:yes stop_codon:yes gene_type:complete
MAITKVSRGLLSTGVSDSSDATAITIDSSENIGIGVTPSTIWSTSYDALQIGIGGSISAHSSAGDALKIGSNFVYEGTAPNYYDKYLTTSTAHKYELDADGHKWFYAASGTAGNAISWSEAMRIASNGNVGIGDTVCDQLFTVKGGSELQATNSTNGWIMYTYTDNTFRLNYNGAGADALIFDTSENATFSGTVTVGDTVFDAVGTYCFATSAGSVADRDGGATLAGSNLRPANSYTDYAGTAGYSNETLSGTWRLMGSTGEYNNGTASVLVSLMGSLWVRIS